MISIFFKLYQEYQQYNIQMFLNDVTCTSDIDLEYIMQDYNTYNLLTFETLEHMS